LSANIALLSVSRALLFARIQGFSWRVYKTLTRASIAVGSANRVLLGVHVALLSATRALLNTNRAL